MATMFEPSLPASAMRPPYSSASAPSMADSLPSINFGFDELRDRMAKFTVKFDAFIETGRKRVLEERNQFRVNIAELQEDQRMKKKDIEILQLKTSSHQQTLAKETAETAEMHAAISALTEQRNAHRSAKDSILSQIASTQALIDAKLSQQRAHAAHVNSQARHDVPELDFWTQNLGLRLEGAGVNDRLKFVFTHIDERDWTKEAWFELNTEKRDYEIRTCKPKLDDERVEKQLEELNESRKLGPLLKGMRELFVEAMVA
ncbi:MAG: kinetochore-associated Ndc80 complex subunit spc25 [Claussenomyces sp. TS43310]|nr:MAG: kinetochore-associated Ndc80 complex subunit spc25 [Claussenomyces sp. TS43310]